MEGPTPPPPTPARATPLATASKPPSREQMPPPSPAPAPAHPPPTPSSGSTQPPASPFRHAAESPRERYEKDLVILARLQRASLLSDGMLRWMATYVRIMEFGLGDTEELAAHDLAALELQAQLPFSLPPAPIATRKRRFSEDAASAHKRHCAELWRLCRPPPPPPPPPRRTQQSPEAHQRSLSTGSLPRPSPPAPAPQDEEEEPNTQPPSSLPTPVAKPRPPLPEQTPTTSQPLAQRDPRIRGKQISMPTPKVNSQDQFRTPPTSPPPSTTGRTAARPLTAAKPVRPPTAAPQPPPTPSTSAAPPTIGHTTQPSQSAAKQPRYPPLVVEHLPDWAKHFKTIAQSLGRPPNARPFGNGVRFSPTDEGEYRCIQNYLTQLETKTNISWFSYALPEEKKLKVAIRGLPVETDTEEIRQAIEEKGYSCEYVKSIRAREGRPGCIYFAQLSRSPEPAPGIYDVTELLCMPGIKIEAWRGKRGPAQCHRCQGFRHSSHNCHRPIACVRCGEGHAASDCPRPKEDLPTCVNCKGPHPANHTSCPVFQREARNKRATTVARTRATAPAAANTTRRRFQPQAPTASASVTEATPGSLMAPARPATTKQPAPNQPPRPRGGKGKKKKKGKAKPAGLPGPHGPTAPPPPHLSQRHTGPGDRRLARLRQAGASGDPRNRVYYSQRSHNINAPQCISR
ncbi:lysine-specific demethylase 6B-like [Pectinophora gossypiella]|uniref:lysine-specific demethylase 6B-like n=1 Tax=Pectinophora gossypiella TaxID=13191 RepID=UPI00214F28E4|nr:lysine-specific demethylase 6B-like [Pectinophora gossypiella]